MSNRFQLYSIATPNGQKISIALEEMGLPYDAHKINIIKGDQFLDSFIKINPNSKIPALIDVEGDKGNPLCIMESGAILLHLAEVSGLFLPEDIAKRSHTLQWLFWQVGGQGPMFGQFGHFSVFAKNKGDLSYPIERYTLESKRLLTVLEKQLEGNDYVIGKELTIADFAIMPWVLCLDKFYNAKDALDLDSFSNINRWLESLLGRPGVQKGLVVCSFD